MFKLSNLHGMFPNTFMAAFSSLLADRSSLVKFGNRWKIELFNIEMLLKWSISEFVFWGLVVSLG